MQEFYINSRVEHFPFPGTEGFGTGYIKEVEHYPDGDVHYYLVQFDNGLCEECSPSELMEEIS